MIGAEVEGLTGGVGAEDGRTTGHSRREGLVLRMNDIDLGAISERPVVGLLVDGRR